jgi:phosphoribosylaminoimidazolecarboxamide formyltransferase/IMP cyclohydrolase
MVKIRRALLSVSDKRGLVEFARGLTALGVTLLGSGGTARVLREAGVPVTEVSEVTGFPEMLDGRVKTLHPAIHAGILARRDLPAHQRELETAGIAPIDLVCVNLYPFRETVARPGVSLAETLEQIDIGGPALVRSAAKNHPAVAVLVNPDRYPAVLAELRAGGGGLSDATRAALAAEAFRHTALYDAAIASHLGREGASPFPPVLALAAEKVQDLRYGENPHQAGAFYRLPGLGGLGQARQLQGKELSYNNLLDCHAAWAAASELPEGGCVIIKHTNPCGAALRPSQVEAYRRARDTDPVSAYGGILGFNAPLEEPTAAEIAQTFVEVVIAPGYTEGALAALKGRKNLRLLEVAEGAAPLQEFRSVGGGLLVQEADRVTLQEEALKVVTRRSPTPQEMADLRFAWVVAKHVKSNAIVFARDGATVGVGAGQMSRVDSCRLAVMKACGPTQGSVVASDAFFPFRDGLDAAAQAGATAIIQPGGSVRDAEVIQAAEEHGMAMLFTGLRHFRH